MAKKKPVKVGVRAGHGQPPYEWNVAILDAGFEQAMDVLKDYQYDHLRDLVRELARHPDPTHSDTLSLDRIEDYHELRDWGGVLNNLNARLFYGVSKQERTIVVLGFVAKKNNGATPLPTKVLMRNRWRAYQRGDFGAAPF